MLVGNRYLVDNLAQFYAIVGSDLLEAETYSPRGLETKEIIAPQIILTNPRQRLVYNQGRKYNIFHALNESIMLYTPTNKVKHIGEFNKAMVNYSDDGFTLYGAYGARIALYIDSIVDKLRKDPDSRQAVLSIYNSADIVRKTKDVPCTSNLQFFIRDKKLHLITTMRSNDILYGFQYDVFMFTMLQETIANELEIDLGYYMHNTGSLHVYKEYPSFDGYEMLEKMGSSVPMGMVNNSLINDWQLLAHEMVTGEPQSKNINGTALKILKIMLCERMYKNLPVKNEAVVKFFRSMYNDSPQWAKPFIKKWNNLEVE